ncbi:Uncharacterised protein [Flavonifractor plautii]|uniref:Uncharacterized protein n=1 Tax=Flavonifractor plautii TaxID=292800 RepID=A0A174TAG4_FLAPL|nr:Uncharacterised protein [Flavonifractor plautii]
MLILPTSLSSSKFCMLRAPTCTTSTSRSKSSAIRGSMISVTMGRPVCFRASISRSRPAVPMPWKE